MNGRMDQMNWQSLLPEAYNWADRVKVEAITAPKDQAWHVVAAQKNDAGVALDAPALSAEVRSQILAAAEKLGFKGKGPLRLVLNQQNYLLVPLTSVETTAPQRARQLGMDAAAELRDAGVIEVVLVPGNDTPILDLFEGFATSYYDKAIFKTAPKKNPEWPDRINLLTKDFDAQALKERRALVKALILSRTLQDLPGNWLNSERLGTVVSEALQHSHARCTILGREDMKKLGMGAFLSVAAGSPVDPKLICIEIDGTNPNQTVALVGKGVTFDAGGISLKPAAGMDEMKYDMSGAAAVFGAALYMTAVKPPVNVICVIGAVENLPSGTATRPGDVVQAMNGKTIEVLNTDAEGRLVLCDCLAYVSSRFKPQLIIDIATLTGAVLQGLGHAGAAIMTNQDRTAEFVQRVAARAGEPVWRLPLWPELAKETKGDVADLKNIAKPNVMAGTIMGGHFLKEFIDEKTEWAHIDIAGTAWSCSATGFASSGGSGFGLRTMVRACFELGG